MSGMVSNQNLHPSVSNDRLGYAALVFGSMRYGVVIDVVLVSGRWLQRDGVGCSQGLTLLTLGIRHGTKDRRSRKREPSGSSEAR